VNDLRLESFDQLRRELGKFTPGEEVTIEVNRIVQTFDPPGEGQDLDSLLPESLLPRVKLKRQSLKLKVVLGKRQG
jgi:hypothetical protein